MLPNDDLYTQFGLTRDMLATVDIIRQFDAERPAELAAEVRAAGRLLMTGEGSSRLFPAKNAIAHARRSGYPIELHTEAGLQSAEYDLRDWAVFALSNSGRTAEVIGLFSKLQELGHQQRFSLTALPDSKLQSLATRGYVLACGKESAVAATKSVVEQALFYRAMLEHAANHPKLAEQLATLADAFEHALVSPIAADVVERVAGAKNIFWAGRNDGVAEELTLKTNEITRKNADYLEGTYALHGVEEVMDADDVVIWIDPYPGIEDKIRKTLIDGVGLTVIAMTAHSSPFPSISVQEMNGLNGFVQMAAGWNLLVEVGLRLGVDVDKPQRARKVGNEFEADP